MTHVLSFEYQDWKKAGEVAQWVKVPPAEPGILGFIPGTHKVEEEKPLLRSYRMFPPTHAAVCASVCGPAQAVCCDFIALGSFALESYLHF